MNSTTLDSCRSLVAANPHRVWLVTGSAGFIGSHCVEALLQLNQRVIGLDVIPLEQAPNLKEVALYRKQWDNYTHIVGDVRDLDRMLLVQYGVNIILHHAGLIDVTESELFKTKYTRVNIGGTRAVFNAAEYAPCVDRVVYASSAAVYGQTSPTPTSEPWALRAVDLSHYGKTKRQNERDANLHERANFSDCMFVGLRYFNVYGPRQQRGVLARWARNMSRQQHCELVTSHNITRDFIHVDDVVQANIRAATKSGRDMPFESIIFNVGSGYGYALRDVYDAMCLVCEVNADAPVPFIPIVKGAKEIVHSQANITRINRWLDFTPTVIIANGLDELIQWHYGQQT